MSDTTLTPQGGYDSHDLSLRKQRMTQVFTIMSVGENDHIMASAMELARHLSLYLGFRVLLIDALLDADDNKKDIGLSEYLSKDCESALPLIQTITAPDLYLLPKGTKSFAAPIRYYESRLSQLMDELKAEFEFIIVVSHSVLESAISQSLAPISDKSLLVVEDKKTLMAELRESREILLDFHARHVGVIFERSKPFWQKFIK